MSRFEHLHTKLDTSTATVWMELPEIADGAAILMRPATAANPAYNNAMMKRTAKMVRPGASLKGGALAQMQKQMRDDDRELYPMHVFVQWRGIVDVDGTPVEFTAGDAKELMRALPNWLVDRIRNFAASDENFVPDDEESDPTPADAEDLGKS